MSAAAVASVIHAQVSGCHVYECPECSAYHATLLAGKHLLWWEFCERCGGHYVCESCGHVFILRQREWFRLMPNDSLLPVGR